MKSGMFRERSIVVEAYRFSLSEPFPCFLHTAMLAGDAWYQGGSEPYLTIKAYPDNRRARIGDWVFRIIDDSDFSRSEPNYGPLQVASNEAFHRRYEPK